MTKKMQKNQSASRLNLNCLPFGEILTQSVAVIAPTTVAASYLTVLKSTISSMIVSRLFCTMMAYHDRFDFSVGETDAFNQTLHMAIAFLGSTSMSLSL